MTKIDVVISVVGWEERFPLGVIKDLERLQPATLIVFIFEEYVSLTQENRSKVSEAAKRLGIAVKEITVNRDPLALWKSVIRELDESLAHLCVLLNVSTMPRELMWWACLRLETIGAQLFYSYYKPGAYASDWLTRDTGQPRLLYQLSGISLLGKPTCLLLLTGFDMDRAIQIIEFFEPAVVLIGIQTGAQFANDLKNIERSITLKQRAKTVCLFNLDAAAADRGLSAMSEAVSSYLGNYNIVGASLGPKVSALALYRLTRMHTEIALAYAPSREFNPAYSSGVGEVLEGSLT